MGFCLVGFCGRDFVLWGLSCRIMSRIRVEWLINVLFELHRNREFWFDSIGIVKCCES